MLDKLPEWLEPESSRLTDLHRKRALPHAVLLHGPTGIGSKLLGLDLGRRILCERELLVSCGQCKSCQLLKSGTHPDYYLVEPEEEGKQLKVDQIRDLIVFANKTSQQGHGKVIVLQPAEQMNINSANALLKVLEEPPQETYIILVTSRIDALLPTIKSRCSLVSVPKPSLEQSEKWLGSQHLDSDQITDLINLTANEPLKAIEWMNNGVLDTRNIMLDGLKQMFNQQINPVELAATWNKRELGELVYWLSYWFCDLTRATSTRMEQLLRDKKAAKLLKFTAKRSEPDSIFEFTDYILATRSGLLNNTNLNSQLILESILIRWQKLVS